MTNKKRIFLCCAGLAFLISKGWGDFNKNDTIRSHAFAAGHAGAIFGRVNTSFNYGNALLAEAFQMLNLLRGENTDYPNIASNKNALFGGTFGLGIGYTHVLQDSCALFGAEVDANFCTAKGKGSFPMLMPSGNRPLWIGASLGKISVRDKGHFDAALKFGATFDRWLFYVIMGCSTHCTSLQLISTDYQLKFKPKWSLCFLTGAGMDFKLSPSWLLGTTLKAHIGNRKRLDKWNIYPDNTSNAQVNHFIRSQLDGFYAKQRPILMEVLVSVKYMWDQKKKQDILSQREIK
jgi:hypothetical protein